MSDELSLEDVKALIVQHEQQAGITSEEFLRRVGEGTAPDTFEALDWQILLKAMGVEVRMDDWMLEEINARADEIREQLQGSRLYGHPIDHDNPDMMIVAAYLWAMHQSSVRNIERLELEVGDEEKTLRQWAIKFVCPFTANMPRRPGDERLIQRLTRTLKRVITAERLKAMGEEVGE